MTVLPEKPPRSVARHVVVEKGQADRVFEEGPDWWREDDWEERRRRSREERRREENAGDR